MKEIKLIIVLTACSLTASAQWSETGDNYTTGNLGIGSSSSGSYKVEISNGTDNFTNINGSISGTARGIYSKVTNWNGPLWLFETAHTTTNRDNQVFRIHSNETGVNSMPFYISVGSTLSAPTYHAIIVNSSGNVGLGGNASSIFKASISATPENFTSFTSTQSGNSRGFYSKVANWTDSSTPLWLFETAHTTSTDRNNQVFRIHANETGSSALPFRITTGGTVTNPTNEAISINSSGNVGIGVISADSKLVVDGKIRSEEVKVEIINGPDYVFEPSYELRTLKETKEYLTNNKHLPEIPPAREMEANGIDLGDMNMRLLKKIEELTLHQIELLEKLERQNEELQEQQKRIEKLENK